MSSSTLRILAASVLLLASSLGQAQTAAAYPCGVIKFIVPYPPGGASDLLARMLAPALNRQLGASIVVENKAGASGNIGTGLVSSGPADGCTLLLGNSTGVVINRSLYKLANDPATSLAPVAEVASVPMVLYVNSSLPVNNLRELIDLVRRNPGKYSYASPGSGSTHHLLAELLKREQNLFITHIPYRGSGPAIADVLAGQVQIAFEGTSAIAPHLSSGRIKALATTGATRSANMPDVPTMKELGYPKFVVANWYGVFVQARTPGALVNRLNAEIRKSLKSPEIAGMLAKMGSDTSDYSAVQYAGFVKREIPFWASLVKQTGARID